MANVDNNVSGDLVGVWISTDPDAATPVYKEVVCGEDIGLNGSKDVTTRRTRCGTIKSVGSNSWQMTFSGVANHTPGGTEMSANEMAAIQQGTDKIGIRFAHADNNALYYREGKGYMTNYSEDGSEGDVVGFDATVEINGDLTLVPA